MATPPGPQLRRSAAPATLGWRLGRDRVHYPGSMSNTPPPSNPGLDLESEVLYQIYPQSFADSNGDGIGDLAGITSKLDYLADLGITMIWLNPIFDSPFKDAGYDVRDYYQIAPRYGTTEDLVTLVEQAHRHGIKVLLDLVPGHTSEEHAWFQQSARPEPNEFSDRYIWTEHAFDNGAGLPFIGGEYDRNGTYILNFFKSQPALNYGFHQRNRPWQQSPDAPGPMATRQAMVEVMKHWLELGCDGFRVDMADSLVKFDTEDKQATIAVWQDMIGRVRAMYPNAILVSEWGKPELAHEAGFDMDFYLDWGDNGYHLLTRESPDPLDRTHDRSFFAQHSDTPATDFIVQYEPLYRHGLFNIISGNHDTPRLAPRLTKTERMAFFFFLLTMPGVPTIYYGDEIGMEYVKIPTKEGGYARTGSRTPMQWDSTQPNYGFSTAAPESLYLPVSGGPSVDKQPQLLALTRQLIAIRRATPALQASAPLEFLPAPHPRLLAYRRSHLTIVINPSAQPLDYPDANGTMVAGIGGAELTEAGLHLPPTAAAIVDTDK